MKRFVILLSSLCLLTTACKKDNQGTTAPPPGNSTPLLKTVVYQNLPSPYYHFVYDGNGKMTNAAFASGAFTYSLSYQDDRVKEMRSILASTKISATYQYDNAGRISFIKISNEDGSQVFKRAFLSYDNQNHLTEIEWELNTTAGFALQRTLSFLYYDDGNLQEKRDHRHFIEGRQQEATYIDRFEQYDDKLNVDDFSLLHESSEHLVLFPGVKLQHGNPAKIIRTGDGTNYEMTCSYSYNSNKQPVQRAGSMLITNGPQAGQTFQLSASYSYYD
jgi:hypothetical protein